ncbi:cytosine permease [Bacillus canaveralius]|uniref:cytosine permease n=1 Tax=Bacillus canaveralius TaxID=1403243 RepID=UPI001C8B77C0|nr:cytosine permease [Bacillus canaveralius]
MTNQRDTVLEEEYEHVSVPLDKRKSLLSVSLVWIGFPMIITGAVTGAAIVAGLGFIKGILAILIGNLLLFAYVGGLSVLSSKKGYNFGLQASITFGRKGSIIVSGLLSTLVIGWFAVHVGLTGTSMNQAFGSNLLVMSLLGGILYLLVTLIGVKALTYIGAISAPLFFILGLWAVGDAVSNAGWSTIVSYSGNGSIAFGIAITMVIALFADSGTMTGDFNRWSKNSRESLLATASAFPFANAIAMSFGGLITASALGNPDFFHYIAAKGGVLSIVAVILLFLNIGSVSAHCLYNGAVGWANILGKKMRTMTVILGIIGIIVGIFGIYNFFITWLGILGVIVPPIGAVIIIDQFIVRKNADITENLRIKAFIAWGIGSLIAMLVEFYAPYFSTAVSGIIVAGLAYWALSLSDQKVNQPQLNPLQR